VPRARRARLVAARAGAMLATLAGVLAPASAHAQWKPVGALAAVPVIDECRETGGDVMATRLEPPTIYVCPHVVELIRRRHPGAEHFYLVHEYGHLALRTSDERAADCWAAQALARAPHGARYLAIFVAHLRSRRPDDSPRYDSPAQRAQRILDCAAEAASAPASP
jgi:hypothetical protein